MEKMTKESFINGLKEGLKYPWGKASRLWLVLWVLVPIFGWFALGGYGKKIVRSIVSGHKKELPEFGKFWTNFKEGIFILVFMIPTMVVLVLMSTVPFIGKTVTILADLFLFPWLATNFFMKETFDSLWEIKKAYQIVSNHLVEYLFMFLKTIAYTIIYGILSIVLVGIPCLSFGSNFYWAEFYGKHK